VLEAANLRRVFGAFPTGVTALAALGPDGRPIGLAASSFTSVSLDPPIVSVAIGHGSTTWPRLRASDRLGVTVLGAHQEQACVQLSRSSPDRFSGLSWRSTLDGAVLIDGSAAWLDCSIEMEVTAGDHDVIFLRVHELDADHSVEPLVFHASRFWRLRP
jgi:flavin reductase (DIM6/NTAB) family NADH-FMN oxidoreductase RutF